MTNVITEKFAILFISHEKYERKKFGRKKKTIEMSIKVFSPFLTIIKKRFKYFFMSFTSMSAFELVKQQLNEQHCESIIGKLSNILSNP